MNNNTEDPKVVAVIRVDSRKEEEILFNTLARADYRWNRHQSADMVTVSETAWFKESNGFPYFVNLFSDKKLSRTYKYAWTYSEQKPPQYFVMESVYHILNDLLPIEESEVPVPKLPDSILENAWDYIKELGRMKIKPRPVSLYEILYVTIGLGFLYLIVKVITNWAVG